MQSPRKHPRTMKEAFGPYTSDDLYIAAEPMTLGDRVIVVVGVIIGACTLAAIFTGVI